MHHLSRREFAAMLGAAALARADTSEDLAGLTVSAAASKIRGPPFGFSPEPENP